MAFRADPLTIAFAVAGIAAGIFIARHRRRGYRLMGVGMMLVSISMLIQSYGSSTLGPFEILGYVLSFGGLTLSFTGLVRVWFAHPSRGGPSDVA